MTAKEKAKELIKKYSVYHIADDVWNYEYSKECALIAVNEVIESIGYSCRECQDEQNDKLNFWIEVKQELERQ